MDGIQSFREAGWAAGGRDSCPSGAPDPAGRGLVTPAPVTPRYPILSVVALIAGVVVLTLLLVGIAAESQNRFAIQSAQHLAGSALRVEIERGEGFVGDYSFWNDSAQHLVVARDRQWAADNIGASVMDNLGMSASLLVDGAGLAMFATIDGMEQGADAGTRFSEELGQLVEAARDGAGRPGDRPTVVSSFLMLDGTLALAAAAAIKWEDARPVPLADGAPATLVFVRRVDAGMLRRFEERYLLAGIRLAPAGTASPDSAPILSIGERELARLAWTGARPGTELIEELAFPALGIVVLAAGLLTLITQRARRSAEELTRSHLQLAIHAAALKDSTRALRAALSDAATANAAKSDFLARMSHELRTPLNAILGFSELIATQYHGADAGERYQEYGRMIHLSGGHLLSLINDILDLSKIEAGGFELIEEQVDLDAILEQCLALLAPTVDAKRLGLSYAPAAVRLHADPRAIKQIVLNLLSNAVKFTPEGGEVRVASADEAGGITITVADTGCGMSQDDLARVFRVFGRSRATIARDGEGTGLGLNIAKGLVELHGGSLTLRSQPGAGTTAEAWFPASRSQTPAQGAAAG